jgi:hypothetical protein
VFNHIADLSQVRESPVKSGPKVQYFVDSENFRRINYRKAPCRNNKNSERHISPCEYQWIEKEISL